MRCEDVVEYLQASGDRATGMRRAAAEHAASCDSCWTALRAVEALRAERARPVPAIAGGLERALARTAGMPQARARHGGFWLGALVGGALAASLTVAVLVGIPTGDPPAAAAPEVRVALNSPHDVSVALDTPVPLPAAQIHVTLNGAIEIAGFAGQRELTWSTDLASGSNRLTLPVVALDGSGGQVSIEVRHGDKRRAFLVDVRTTQAAATTGA